MAYDIPALIKRQKKIKELRKKYSLREIGKMYNLSHERIKQISEKEYNLDRLEQNK